MSLIVFDFGWQQDHFCQIIGLPPDYCPARTNGYALTSWLSKGWFGTIQAYGIEGTKQVENIVIDHSDEVKSVVFVGNRLPKLARMPSNYYCISNSEELEQALNTHFDSETRDKLDRRVIRKQHPRMIDRISITFTQSISPSIAPTNTPQNTPLRRRRREQTEEDEKKEERADNGWRKRIKAPEPGESCITCNAYAATIALVPCGHQDICDECIERLMATTKVCPQCREPIQNIIRPIKHE